MIFQTKNITFICPLWGQFLLRTASINIMAACPTLQCAFCFRIAQSAAFPVNPCQYASMNCQEWLKKMLDNLNRAHIKAFTHDSLCDLKFTFINLPVLVFAPTPIL